MNLGGTFTLASIGTFTRTSGTAGTVNLTGTLTNTGATLPLDTLNNGFGTWNLVGGTLSSGTLVTTNSAVLQCAFPNTGTLNAVTVAANSDFITSFGRVAVTGGLTVNGRVTITGDGNRGLFFTGTQTLDGTGEVVLAGDNMQLNQEGMTLTIGANLTIDGSTTHFGNNASYTSTAIVNNGTINGQGGRHHYHWQ